VRGRDAREERGDRVAPPLPRAVRRVAGACCLARAPAHRTPSG
jgi:hypothetical protein